LILIFSGSCTGFRSAVRDSPKKQQPQDLPIERVIQRVAHNDEDIQKFFELGDNGDILIKAQITEAGIPFEVRYYLLFAHPVDSEPLPPDIAAYDVVFSVEDTITGELRYGELRWKFTEDETGVLLGFDDDYISAWQENFDRFDRYGARVTFFIKGELIPFCAEALSRGHDVGYHTIHHIRNLATVSPEIFETETLSDVDTFRNAGIPLVSFAWPYGLSEPWMREKLADSFAIQRGYGTTFRIYDVAAIQEGYVASRAIDNVLFKKEPSFQRMITLMLRTLKFLGGKVLPITTHNIADDADWGIKPQRLDYLLQSANDLKLRYYRYQDFF
jgi:peptidoglycan/xylan/chitin deacetylase (PgdA/CDA1 family)